MCYSYTCFPLDGLLNVFVLLCTILRALYRSPPTPVVGLFIYFIVISQSIWLQRVSDVSGMTRAYLCIIHDVTNICHADAICIFIFLTWHVLFTGERRIMFTYACVCVASACTYYLLVYAFVYTYKQCVRYYIFVVTITIRFLFAK